MCEVDCISENEILYSNHTLLTMNIFSALRSRTPEQRAQLITRLRRHIHNEGFVGILESIDVRDVQSIRMTCLQLNAYQKVPYLRPRLMAWMHGY